MRGKEIGTGDSHLKIRHEYKGNRKKDGARPLTTIPQRNKQRLEELPLQYMLADIKQVLGVAGSTKSNFVALTFDFALLDYSRDRSKRIKMLQRLFGYGHLFVRKEHEPIIDMIIDFAAKHGFTINNKQFYIDKALAFKERVLEEQKKRIEERVAKLRAEMENESTQK